MITKFVIAVLFTCTDAVSYVRDILQDIQNNIGQTNVDELLRQAREMLQEIRTRNFDAKDRDTNEELDNAAEGNTKWKD